MFADNPVTLAVLSDVSAAALAVEDLVNFVAAALDAGTGVPVEAFIACKTTGPDFVWR